LTTLPVVTGWPVTSAKRQRRHVVMKW
jgi:hypothetical protein